MARPLSVNAAELLRRPGTEKLVQCAVAVEDLGIDDARFRPGSSIQVDLRLESLSDGIVVEGTLLAPWAAVCRRCLKPVSGIEKCAVRELYQVVVTDDDAFAITGDQLNLVSMVRECVLLDVPMSPLCRGDCAGLCLSCGVDRNVSTCACTAPKQASPWDVLDQLRSDLDEK